MSVNTRVVNKRAAVSTVYNVLYSINKVEVEDGAYGGTGELFLWHDSSESSRTRELHLQPPAQILWTAEMHTGEWRITNCVCVCVWAWDREWKWERSEKELQRTFLNKQINVSGACLRKCHFHNAVNGCHCITTQFLRCSECFFAARTSLGPSQKSSKQSLYYIVISNHAWFLHILLSTRQIS